MRRTATIYSFFTITGSFNSIFSVVTLLPNNNNKIIKIKRVDYRYKIDNTQTILCIDVQY